MNIRYVISIIASTLLLVLGLSWFRGEEIIIDQSPLSVSNTPKIDNAPAGAPATYKISSPSEKVAAEPHSIQLPFEQESEQEVDEQVETIDEVVNKVWNDPEIRAVVEELDGEAYQEVLAEIYSHLIEDI